MPVPYEFRSDPAAERRLFSALRDLPEMLQKRALDRGFRPGLLLVRDETRRRIKRIPRARGGRNPKAGFRKAYGAAGAFKVRAKMKRDGIQIEQFVKRGGKLNWVHFMEYGTTIRHPTPHRGWRAWRVRERTWKRHERRVLRMTEKAVEAFAADPTLTAKELRERVSG